MSFTAEIKTRYDPEFYANSRRFATKEEAAIYAHSLYSKWDLAEEYRVVESDEPVNHRLTNGELQRVGP